jgi:hypothetical protein
LRKTKHYSLIVPIYKKERCNLKKKEIVATRYTTVNNQIPINNEIQLPWPPRSPDLTPLDYFVRGHVKSLIYDTHVDMEFELLTRILVARDVFHETPGIRI